MVNPQITNLVVMLVMMQVGKKIPFEDPSVLMGIRGLYLLSNLLILAVNMYIIQQVNKKKDMTTLKYVEPPPMGSQEDPKLVTTTIHAYDLAEAKKGAKGQLMGVAMMAFMHLYMKYTNPLLIQSILPLKGAFETNLAKIHIFGSPAAGDLKRPWKAAGGLMGAMSGQGAGEMKTDRAAIEAAERSGRGGAKEE